MLYDTRVPEHHGQYFTGCLPPQLPDAQPQQAELQMNIGSSFCSVFVLFIQAYFLLALNFIIYLFHYNCFYIFVILLF